MTNLLAQFGPRRFATITADPPWPYDTAVKGTRALPAQLVADGSRLQRPVSDWTYDPMPIEEIKALPVSEVALPDAHLWLWTTNAFMREAYEVVDAWGFTPKTILTWGKVKKDDPTTPSMKSGYYLRGATEHAILAVRGRTPKPQKAVPTLLLTPRIAQHSRKPDEFYDVVETISPGPYLEMFARRTHDGWSSWGNQLDDPVLESGDASTTELLGTFTPPVPQGWVGGASGSDSDGGRLANSGYGTW